MISRAGAGFNAGAAFKSLVQLRRSPAISFSIITFTPPETQLSEEPSPLRGAREVPIVLEQDSPQCLRSPWATESILNQQQTMFTTAPKAGYYIFVRVSLEVNREMRSCRLVISNKNEGGIFQEYKYLIGTGPSPIHFPQFDIKYLFEAHQPLKLDLYDEDQFLGCAQTTLAQIIHGPITLELADLLKQSSGRAVLKSELSQLNQRKIGFDLEVQLTSSLLRSLLSYIQPRDRISLLFYKMVPHKQVILQTEQKDRASLVWKGLETNFEIFCDNDPLQSIFCEVVSHRNHSQETVGSFEFWLYYFDQSCFEFALLNAVETVGRVIFSNYKFDIEGRFYSYIQQGVQLQLVIAIDFTHSSMPLHKLKNNQFLEAIESVSEILLHYDHDKRVPLYGFGGIPRFSHSNKHCFALTGDENHCEVSSLSEILEAYKFAVQGMQFDGPTFYNPLLRRTIKHVHKGSSKDYYVLLILTDGRYMDEEQTIESLLECSRLPISVIIVGIGDAADLTAMRTLDMGLPCQRDVVKYVHFNDFKNDRFMLTRQILDELPSQLVSYFQASEGF